MSTAEFNSCSSLVTQNEFTKDIKQDYYDRTNQADSLESPFQKMLEMQQLLQVMYSKKHNRQKPPTDLETKGELIDFLFDQKQAMDDEFRELIEAIHGMSRPASLRSAGWKKWKKEYDTIRNEKIDENLTPEDIIERDMEVVDYFHFYMNTLIALGMTEEKLFLYYNLKNKENYDRQENNY